ncbi:hypothetical protein BBW65_00405 [Helicobacter enhydrae]|uniref:Uncharacterized protein n=1 Tax=Helicobacter enhydrae TaxID=222136 RepID=A0A1B1U3L6_9HELI|nr:hypothetical protein BBW65_00405 [Helicobacter enhydrae]
MYKGWFTQGKIKKVSNQPLKHHKVTLSPKVTQSKRILEISELPKEHRSTNQPKNHRIKLITNFTKH